MPVSRVAVFCGSSLGRSPRYADVAAELGRELAARGIGLVYGGGAVGLMGVLADAVMSAGGEVIGVIPAALLAKEIGHLGLSELVVTESMHERKARMADLAEGFIALPGGLGTYEELCEILTWGQLGYHAKPVVVLDVEGFYEQLFALFDHAVGEGFVRPLHRSLANRAETVHEALALLAQPPPAVVPKWIGPDET
jgi:uncharacterized protein (TIGR00730 family)